jgi:hypothetical protein
MTTVGSPPVRGRRRTDRARTSLIGVETGFIVESPDGRVGVLIDVRTIEAGRARRVDTMIVSAGASLRRVLIIPASEIREVLPARGCVVICASPRMTGTESRCPPDESSATAGVSKTA